MSKLIERAAAISSLLGIGEVLDNDSIIDTIDELMEIQRIQSEALSKIADNKFDSGIGASYYAQQALKKAGLR